MLKFGSDSILFQYVLADTVPPYSIHTSHSLILKTDGTIIKDKVFNTWKDSSFYYAKIIKSVDNNFWGAGLTNDSNIELMKFDPNLNSILYIKIKDSTCYTRMFSTITAIGNKILLGGRCSSHKDSTDDTGYIYDVDASALKLNKSFYFTVPSHNFYPSTLHYRAKDSCYYFVSKIHPIKMDSAGYDAYINKMNNKGHIDTVMLIHGDFGLVSDSIYNLIDYTSFLDYKDSIFYLSSTAYVDVFDSSFQTIAYKRYPYQLSLRYDDFKKIKEQIISENSEGDLYERAGTNSIINKNDTLYQLTFQKTNQRFRIQAFNLNLKKLFEFYVPFSTHNLINAYASNFDVENKTFFGAGCDGFINPYLLVQTGVFLGEKKSEQNVNVLCIYPNPNTGTFNINFNNTEGEKKIYVYNLKGKLVAHYATFNNVYEVQESVPNGMYFIKVETLKGVFNSKFVVK